MILLLWFSVMLGCVDLFCAETQKAQRFLVPFSFTSQQKIQLFLYKEPGERGMYNGLPIPDDATIKKDEHCLEYTHEGVIFYFFLKNKTLPNALNTLFERYVTENKLGLPDSFFLKIISLEAKSNQGNATIIYKPLIGLIVEQGLNLEKAIRALQKEISKDALILQEKKANEKYNDLVRRTATNQKVPTETSKTPTNSVRNVLVVHKDGQYYVALWSKKDGNIYTYNLINTKKLNEWASHKVIQTLGETYYCNYDIFINSIGEEKRRSLVFIARSDFNEAQKEQFADTFTPNHKGIINEATFETIKNKLASVNIYNQSNDKPLSHLNSTITSPGKPQPTVYIFKEGQTYYYILKAKKSSKPKGNQKQQKSSVKTYSYILPDEKIVSILNDKSMQQTKLESNIILVKGDKDVLLKKGYVLVSTSENVQSNSNVSALGFDQQSQQIINATGTIKLDAQLIVNVRNFLTKDSKSAQSAPVSSASASIGQPVGWWGILFRILDQRFPGYCLGIGLFFK